MMPITWFTRNIFFLAFCFFTFYACHYLQINRSGVGLQLPFNAMAWIPLSFMVGAGLVQMAANRRVFYSPLAIKLFICCLLLLVPLFYFNALYRNINDRFLALGAGFLLYFSFQQFQFRKDALINAMLLLLVAVWIEMLIGWDQFFRNNGMSLLGNSGERSGPITGVFQQRNAFASLLAFGTVLSAYLLACEGKTSGKKFHTSMLPLILLPLFSIHLLNIVYSRTGWLGMFIGCLLVFPYLWKRAGKILSMAWLVSLLAGFVLTWCVSATGNVDSSSLERFNLEGLRQIQVPQITAMFLEKPFAGYGYGRFESAYLKFSANKFASGEFAVPGVTPLDHPHNELLFWAVEGGIIPLIALLLAAWFVWQRVASRPLAHRLALIALFFPIVLHTQLEFPFYISVLHWVIFIFLIFWVDNLSAQYKEKTFHLTLLLWISGLLIPVLTTVFMATTLHTGWLLARFEFGLNPDVQALTRISNSMAWSERINWAMRSRLAVNGIINRRPEQIQSYIDWAPKILESKPRPTFYRYLILAYNGIGDAENMLRVQQEASHLFPDESFELGDIAGTVLRQVPFEVISRN